MTEALNIAIVEDDKVHADITCRLLKEWLIEKDIKHYIKKYISAEAFLFEWEQNQLWDALFLDIQMPGINGMELAKSVREHNNDVSIVFAVSYTHLYFIACSSEFNKCFSKRFINIFTGKFYPL